MFVVKKFVEVTGQNGVSGRRSSLRRPRGTPNGTNVMALYPVARGFSTGDTRRELQAWPLASADANIR